MKISDITKDAVVIDENMTLYDATAKMVKEQTNALLVTGEDGVLVGEINVSDLYDAVIPMVFDGDDVLNLFKDEAAFNKAVLEAKDTPVFEFMSTDFTPVNADDSLITIASQAVGFQRSRIPVVDKENRPIGIISRQGLKHILAQKLGLEIS